MVIIVDDQLHYALQTVEGAGKKFTSRMDVYSLIEEAKCELYIELLVQQYCESFSFTA